MKEKTNSIKARDLRLYKENDLKPLSYKTDKLCFNFDSIFQKKKKLDSVFDHKGSKQFLNSKKLALQHIRLDEDNFSNNNSDTQSESDNKQKKKSRLAFPKTTILKNAHNRAKSSNNIFFLENNNLKDKKNEPRKSKNLDKNFHNMKTLVAKEFNVTKKINKFFSSQELKMFSDKEIKKIKPIKKVENKKKDKSENKFFHFIESDKDNNSIDSSILKVVSQIN